MYQRLFKILVPLFTLFICAICIEVGLSLYFGKNDTYYIWRPHLEFQYDLDTTVLNGVSPIAHSSFSDIGARSDRITEKHHTKIAVFGGSTTECIVLDQDKTWTQVLQNALNTSSDRDHSGFWVGNFGKSGNATNHHVLQTAEMLQDEQLKDTKLVIYLVGFNDLWKTIEGLDEYVNFDPEILKRSAFMVVPDRELPFHRRTGTWKFLKRTRYNYRLQKHDKKKLADLYKQIRKKRLEAEKTTAMPELQAGLDHYMKNLDSLIALCKSTGKKPVFLTQPVLWRPDITAESEKLLNTYFENHENLETITLYSCMKLFNEALISVADANHVTYIDLFNRSEEDWFYDDCHFNIKGAKNVAEIISTEIKPLLKP